MIFLRESSAGPRITIESLVPPSRDPTPGSSSPQFIAFTPFFHISLWNLGAGCKIEIYRACLAPRPRTWRSPSILLIPSISSNLSIIIRDLRLGYFTHTHTIRFQQLTINIQLDAVFLSACSDVSIISAARQPFPVVLDGRYKGQLRRSHIAVSRDLQKKFNLFQKFQRERDDMWPAVDYANGFVLLLLTI